MQVVMIGLKVVLKRITKTKKNQKRMTVISLGIKLPNAEAKETTSEGKRMSAKIRSGGSSKVNTTETSRSRSESRTKSSTPSATGRPMSPPRLKKSASDKRESSSKTGRSEKSTSIS